MYILLCFKAFRLAYLSSESGKAYDTNVLGLPKIFHVVVHYIIVGALLAKVMMGRLYINIIYQSECCA